MNKYQNALFVITYVLEWFDDQLDEKARDELIKAVKDIKELIEKETPTKPELISDGDYDGEPVYDMWKCPNCGKLYEIDYDVYDYCPNCGQHIDRSEMDE